MKKTDTDLLDAAAINLGYKLRWRTIGCVSSDLGYTSSEYASLDADFCTEWDPLNSNGDAFKLMVDLKLSIVMCDSYVSTSISYDGSVDRDFYEKTTLGGDIYAAIRRLIVRAAARDWYQ